MRSPYTRPGGMFGRRNASAFTRAGAAAASGDPNAIISVADDGGEKAVFETGAPHGLMTGQFITIEGTEIYDGAGHELTNVLSATTFTTVDDYFAGSATGTWTLE